MPMSSFSHSQWRKGVGYSRCTGCIAALALHFNPRRPAIPARAPEPAKLDPAQPPEPPPPPPPSQQQQQDGDDAIEFQSVITGQELLDERQKETYEKGSVIDVST